MSLVRNMHAKFRAQVWSKLAGASRNATAGATARYSTYSATHQPTRKYVRFIFQLWIAWVSVRTPSGIRRLHIPAEPIPAIPQLKTANKQSFLPPERLQELQIRAAHNLGGG